MSSRKNSKSTRARKARVSKSTERPVSEIQWAKAYLSMTEQRALTEANPIHINPFVQSTGSGDTVHYVECGLEAMSRVKHGDDGVATDTNCQFGQYLVLQTMVEALRAAQEQMKHEHKLARAHGVIAGASKDNVPEGGRP